MITTAVPGRGNRSGAGLFPGNPTQWDAENNGLDLRHALGLSTACPLPVIAAFDLLPNTGVVPHGEVPCADVYLKQLRGDGTANWSGLAVTLDDGSELVIYNDSHSPRRTNATLMEEFFHLRLNHPRSQIRLLSDGKRERSLDSEVEKIAYGSGAASLVPYRGLRELIAEGRHTGDIADRYEVSRDLVLFRMKVTRLYSKRRGK